MGFSQREVAEMLGMKSASCISRWENSSSIPSWEHILKLSFLYSTLPNQLYDDLWTEVQNELREKKMRMTEKK